MMVSTPIWQWPLNLDHYDRHPELTVEEWEALNLLQKRRAARNMHWQAQTAGTLQRLLQPLDDVLDLTGAIPVHWRLVAIQPSPAIQIVLINPQITPKLSDGFAAGFHELDCFALELFRVFSTLDWHYLLLLDSLYLSLRFSSTESGQVQDRERLILRVIAIICRSSSGHSGSGKTYDAPFRANAA